MTNSANGPIHPRSGERLQFFQSDELPPDRVGVFGTRHLYESFATGAELAWHIDPDNPPPAAYLACFGDYMRACSATRDRGSPMEFMLLIDTVLMLDRWYLGDNQRYTSFDLFRILLRRLTELPPSSRLGRITGFADSADSDRYGRFQNTLLAAADHPSLIAEITASLLDFVPELDREIAGNSVVPSGYRHLLIRAISGLLRLRLDRYAGACPLPMLLPPIRGSRAQWSTNELITILRHLPLVSIGAAIPTRAGAADDPDIFVWHSWGYLHDLLRELVYGAAPCRSRSVCMLARRPSCEGFSRRLRPESQQCPREAMTHEILLYLESKSV